jgi:hypothetical protein
MGEIVDVAGGLELRNWFSASQNRECHKGDRE